MVNQVILIGRLGRDPEHKVTQGGTSVSMFSIATDESYKDKDGEKVQKTEWHRIVTFGKLADICDKYLEKGNLVFIQGKLQTRSWENESGKHQVTEIVGQQMKLLERRRDSQPSESAEDGPRSPAEEDDIPF